MDFGVSLYQQMALKEKLLKVLSYLVRTDNYGRFSGKVRKTDNFWTFCPEVVRRIIYGRNIYYGRTAGKMPEGGGCIYGIV